MRILLADDHAITREGTRRLLESEADLQVIAEAADGEEALHLTRTLHPDILLLDISMPRLSGVGVVRSLVGAVPRTRIVVLTGYDNEGYLNALVRLGVSGYLPKSASSRDLIAAIRKVQAGESHFQTESSEWLRRNRRGIGTDDPTPRELQVLRLVAEGLSNQEIAVRLHTSQRTVQFHIGNLFGKLDASSRTQAVHLARKWGWIP